MVKRFCDICGEEIRSDEVGKVYTAMCAGYPYIISTLSNASSLSGVEEFEAHDECWRLLCEEVKKRRANNEQEA